MSNDNPAIRTLLGALLRGNGQILTSLNIVIKHPDCRLDTPEARVALDDIEISLNEMAEIHAELKRRLPEGAGQ